MPEGADEARGPPDDVAGLPYSPPLRLWNPKAGVRHQTWRGLQCSPQPVTPGACAAKHLICPWTHCLVDAHIAHM